MKIEDQVYKCGHMAEPLIVKNIPALFTEYKVWSDRNNNEMCFPCWCNKKEEDFAEGDPYENDKLKELKLSLIESMGSSGTIDDLIWEFNIFKENFEKEIKDLKDRRREMIENHAEGERK